jgi:hypothetical protein
LGIPVIVTDPSGRDPLVVLPLEQFEAMSGDVGEKPVTSGHLPVERGQEKEGQKKPIKLATESQSEAKFNVPSFEMPPMPMSDEISLEERFYLEPTDDEQVS